MKSNHYFLGNKISQATPVFLMFFYIFSMAAIKHYADPVKLRLMGFGMFQKSIEPFEDLPNFYHVVPQKFIERLVK